MVTVLKTVTVIFSKIRFKSLAKIMSSDADASRDRMLAELNEGSSNQVSGDAANKCLLIRGSDPVMSAKAKDFLPPLLGNVQLTSCTDDDTFLNLLQSGKNKYDVVCFAPGAMRWEARGAAIPGGNDTTKGWNLERYREEVRKTLGENIPIVGTAQEKELVPILRRALELS